MKILVTIDFSDITEQVLARSVILAKAMQAEVFLLHVVEASEDQIIYDYDMTMMGPGQTMLHANDRSEIRDQLAQRFRREHKTLQEYSKDFRNKEIDCKSLMIQGEAVATVLASIEKLSIDFIVVGSHGKGAISQLLLGSTSKDLIKKTPIPIYLIPAKR